MEEKIIDTAYIHRTLRWLANLVVVDYENHCLTSTLTQKMDKLYSILQDTIDWNKLTKQNCIELGFVSYEAHSHEPYEVFCIPAWLYPVIPEGFKVMNTSFEEFKFSRATCPFDINYGTLNYGLKFKNPNFKPKKRGNKK